MRRNSRLQALSNKVALITGSSRGIGRAAALALAKEGASFIGVHCLAQGMVEAEEMRLTGTAWKLVESRRNGAVADPIRQGV